jgi:hypothetical protein
MHSRCSWGIKVCTNITHPFTGWQARQGERLRGPVQWRRECGTLNDINFSIVEVFYMLDDKLFEKQMALLKDFFMHYGTYKIINGNLKSIEEFQLFWIMTNNAHIKESILIWCKIFGNENSNQTHWKELLSKELIDEFRRDLFEDLQIDRTKWNDYWRSMVDFRDKYIAHTEPEFKGVTPILEFAYQSALFYYDWMKGKFLELNNIVYLDDIEEYIEPYLIETKRLVLGQVQIE